MSVTTLDASMEIYLKRVPKTRNTPDFLWIVCTDVYSTRLSRILPFDTDQKWTSAFDRVAGLDQHLPHSAPVKARVNSDADFQLHSLENDDNLAGFERVVVMNEHFPDIGADWGLQDDGSGVCGVSQAL